MLLCEPASVKVFAAAQRGKGPYTGGDLRDSHRMDQERGGEKVKFNSTSGYQEEKTILRSSCLPGLQYTLQSFPGFFASGCTPGKSSL